jgi:hypothetical protein
MNNKGRPRRAPHLQTAGIFEMTLTIHEFLRRIEPRQVDSRGRWKEVPQSRLRAFAAVKEVLCAGGGSADYRRAVAATCAAAVRHEARVQDVWRHVRRYRDRLHYQAEQLKLPI